MWKKRTRKQHPNPKPLEKLKIVDSGPFFPHDPSFMATKVIDGYRWLYMDQHTTMVIADII